jgi:hypothetical protein
MNTDKYLLSSLKLLSAQDVADLSTKKNSKSGENYKNQEKIRKISS